MLTTVAPTPDTLGLPFAEWRPIQITVIEDALSAWSDGASTVAIAPSTGCHGDPNAQVLMADGASKKVSDVVVGDRLAGPAGARTVLGLCRGNEQLYTIKPLKGMPFVVNAHHVLTLQRTCASKTLTWPSLKEAVIDLPVCDYLTKSATFRHKHKLLRSAVTAFENENAVAALPIAPYVLGLLLGDGRLRSTPEVHKTDPELLADLTKESRRFGLTPKELYKHGELCGWSLSGTKGGAHPQNRLSKVLDSLGLRGHTCVDKFVPALYLSAARKERLEILAGLLDTDGHMSGGGYDFISMSSALSQAVCFLARSVGLAAYLQPCEKYCQTGGGGIYYRVSVSGDCSIIPCRIARKRAPARRQIKNVLRTQFEVQPCGNGEYWGFTLDGDGRYLLSDFTVTHNSGKTGMGMALAALTGRTVYLTATKALQNQITREYGDAVVDVRGRSNYKCAWAASASTTCEDGPHMGCKAHRDGGCPYVLQLNAAKQAQAVVTNYAYWIAVNRHGDGLGDIPDLLVCDEAGQAVDEVCRTLSVTLTLRELMAAGTPAMTGDGLDLHAWQQWAPGALTDIRGKVEHVAAKLKTRATDKDLLLESRQLRLLQQKLETIASLQGRWIVDHTHDGNNREQSHGWRFDPVWPGVYCQQYLYCGTPRVLLMGATLNKKTCGLLGAPDAKYHAYPPVFDPRRNPFYFLPVPKASGEGFVRVDKHTHAEDFRALVVRMDQILRSRPHSKSIIHCTSYQRQKDVFALSSERSRLIWHNSWSTQQAIEMFIASDPALGKALISPAVTTGYSFDGDLCRFQIVVKVPLVDTRSKVMQARCGEDEDYADYLTAQAVEQLHGRPMRSESDGSETFMLDGHWQWARGKFANKGLLSRGFQDSCRRVDAIPPAPDWSCVTIIGARD